MSVEGEMSAGAQAPLAGVRVLDLTQVIAGPYCTAMLADMGAEVVKIERPGTGDDLRSVHRYEGREEHEDYFYANNRSKKSVAVDLKKPGGRSAAHELARRADVLVENLSPGTAHRLGMGWEDLSPLNPRLVYCSLSGFGQDGPYRDRPGLDPILQAVSGVMSVTGLPGEEPRMIGSPLADVMAGMFSAFAVVSALQAASREGRGRRIDVSLQDAMLAGLGPRMGETLQAGISPGRWGNENPMRVPANTYRTSDGRYLAIIVQNDRFWPLFCRAMDREDLIGEERFATMAGRLEHREELDGIVARVFSERPSAAWTPRLEAERIPFALVNDFAEALDDPQARHRGIVCELTHPASGPIRVVGPPWIMTGAQAEMTPPPLLGQHTEEILREWIGWNQAQIQAFLVDHAPE
ncbi:MAG: CoA transferase [Nitrospinota bacterium]|jgi:crotonobetainyl-CoA:carnitine CoA-transferase CaiB-like acyl-CoA transferase|nr:CoA transferase [Nitrospinota bacterium]MDP7169095.1 CoA transferase [Nitrospinota bacterium]MDP7371814.1 CoA transferase [Nitrospinota bacterium]MDP7662095.1 CoA transferase [Nitrospinota bacterium]